MNDQNINNEVLMVLPRKTVYTASKLAENWVLNQDSAHFSISLEGSLIATAYWQEADDFGMNRPAIVFEGQSDALRADLFTALMTRMALAYDEIPSKYPLYIRLFESDLELIAQASRMGFVPYFGEWKKKTALESEEDWKRITEALRQAYPAQDDVMIH